MVEVKVHGRSLSEEASLAWNWHRAELALGEVQRAKAAGIVLGNELALRQFVRLFLDRIFRKYRLGELPTGPQAAFQTLALNKSKWAPDYDKGVWELKDLGLVDLEKDEMGGWVVTGIHEDRLIQDGQIIRGPRERG